MEWKLNGWNYIGTKPPIGKRLLCLSPDNEIEVGIFNINNFEVDEYGKRIEKLEYSVVYNSRAKRFPTYWMDIELPEIVQHFIKIEEQNEIDRKIKREEEEIQKHKDRLNDLLK